MEDYTYAKAMREVLEYLKGIDDEDVAKIPRKFLDVLEKNALKDYKCEIDYYKPLAELNISKEAKAIIGLIYYNFWCETEQQKQDFLILLDDNDKVYQEELREKYNIDNIFGNPKDSTRKIKEENNNKAIIKTEKLKWYDKLFNRIKELFKRR